MSSCGGLQANPHPLAQANAGPLPNFQQINMQPPALPALHGIQLDENGGL